MDTNELLNQIAALIADNKEPEKVEEPEKEEPAKDDNTEVIKSLADQVSALTKIVKDMQTEAAAGARQEAPTRNTADDVIRSFIEHM